ncbi:hypothetical protein [Hymenobacter sp.]|jgi:hypothetical protein|uniref:hypothetical protein n=1 Tax=Hymenobacter sp. TaxID=1898978 RepID=UPI002ED87D0B
MTTSDYGTSLPFDYITTFSLLRGIKWERAQAAIRKEIEESRKRLLTAQAEQLLEVRQRLELLRKKNNLEHSLLTEGRAAYNLTAMPVATLQRQTPEINQLMAILEVPFERRSYWMCGPVFRDALAFYDGKHQLVAVLNICFECEQMQNENGVEIQTDITVYPALHQWLTALGHEVEGSY